MEDSLQEEERQLPADSTCLPREVVLLIGGASITTVPWNMYTNNILFLNQSHPSR